MSDDVRGRSGVGDDASRIQVWVRYSSRQTGF